VIEVLLTESNIESIRLTSSQWWSPSWARVGHGLPGKIKKLTTICLFCEILYNFLSVLGFD